MPVGHTIKELGRFTGPGGVVPIFGADAIDFSNSTGWSDSIMPTNSTVNIWQGDNTPSFPFNFTLFAGLQPMPDRQSVHDAMKIMLSWAQHQKPQGKTGAMPPPAVTCTIPGYISSKGSIKDISCSARGPFDAGTPYPTSCTFSGTFVIMPFYDGESSDIASVNEAFTSEAIAGSMFAL